MIPVEDDKPGVVCASLAIFAWNEENAIPRALDSLFRQSLFSHLRQLNQPCEILCVLNGCTDHSPLVAAQCLDRYQREHPDASCFTTRVVNLLERSKINAWNQFVHRLSAPDVRVLFMMDADILIHAPDTLWNMFHALETDPEASVAVDRPCKYIERGVST